jgi:hypothetical protein
MSSNTHFGLFPPSVPRIALPNPHIKKPSLSRGMTIAERLTKPAHTESVVIQINGDDLPQSQDVHSRSSSAEVEGATLPASPIDGNTSHQGLPAQQQNFSRPSLTVSPNLPPPPPRPVSTQTVDGQGPPDLISPVVPMRSMFPTYNPSLPLGRQSYYPQRTTSLPRQLLQRQDYKTRSSTPSQFDEAVDGPKTAPSSIIDFPREMPRGNRYTTYRELPKLWEATNGQEPESVHESFDLEMARYVILAYSRVSYADHCQNDRSRLHIRSRPDSSILYNADI